MISTFYFYIVHFRKNTKILSWFFKINKYFYIFLLFVFISFQIIEINIFPNYIFSRIHLIPINFMYPLILGTYIMLLDKYNIFNSMNKGKNAINLGVMISIVIALFIFSVYYGSINFGYILRDNIFILSNLNFSKEDKIKKEMGIVYDLTKLVNEKTGETSRILIPPQVTPYDQTGNVGYFRYFIYPRYPVNGGLNSSPLDGIDYVLIVRGEGQNAEPDKYFWPKEYVKAEKIYYIEENGEIREFDGDYFPDKFPGIGGLIKLSK